MSATFSAVDDHPDGGEFVGALDDIASLPAVQRLRAAATDLLAVRLGDRVVDVGCGTGDVVRTLAGAVGPTGTVVGIDPSELMLAEARRRTGTRRTTIHYRVGDATRLDLDDASVDAARSERVLQHLADPAGALAELARVTRPGGRIVVIDTDWGMHAVNGADPALTAAILSCWERSIANPFIGRQLPGLFADAGLADPVVVAETFTVVDRPRATLPPFPMMAAAAVDDGAVSAGDADRWLAELAEAGRAGRFFWAATMFAVGATR